MRDFKPASHKLFSLFYSFKTNKNKWTRRRVRQPSNSYHVVLCVKKHSFINPKSIPKRISRILDSEKKKKPIKLCYIFRLAMCDHTHMYTIYIHLRQNNFFFIPYRLGVDNFFVFKTVGLTLILLMLVTLSLSLKSFFWFIQKLKNRNRIVMLNNDVWITK